MPVLLELEIEFRKRHGDKCFWIPSMNLELFEDGAFIDKRRDRYDPPTNPAHLARLKYEFQCALHNEYANAYNSLKQTCEIQNQYHRMRAGPPVPKQWLDDLAQIAEKTRTQHAKVQEFRRALLSETKQDSWVVSKRKAEAQSAELQRKLDDLPNGFAVLD